MRQNKRHHRDVALRKYPSAVQIAALLALPSVSLAGLLVTAENPGVQASQVFGASTYNFDGLTIGQKTTAVSGVFNYASQGTGFAIMNPDAFGGSNQTQYLAIGNASPGTTSVTLTLTSAQSYVGIYWPAGDANNYLKVYSGTTLLADYSLGRLNSLLPVVTNNNPNLGTYLGNPNTQQNTGENYAYINFFGTGGTTFDRLVFNNNNSTGTAFETDNHSVANGVSVRGNILEEVSTSNEAESVSGWVTPALSLGAIHVRGDFAAKTAYVDNTGKGTGAQQKLDAAVSSTTGNVTATGSITGLLPDVLPVAALTIDIPTTTAAGAVTATVTTAFTKTQNNHSLGNGSTTVTGMIYSGQSTWNTTTGGNWGGNSQDPATHDSWIGTASNVKDTGAPGVWLGDLNPSNNFDNVDTATFGSTLTAAATITVTTPVSVKSIAFTNNNVAKGTYTIAPGTGSLTMKSDTGTATLSDTSGRSANTITAPITLQSNLDVSVTNAGTLTVSSLLKGTSTQTVNKTGNGTLLITGTGAAASTYTGATTVTGGTLRVDGSITASAVTVKTGATLSGVLGNIASTVAIESGATLSPGGASSASQVSKLTTGAETWKSGGTYVATVSQAVAGAATGVQTFTDLVDMSSLTVEGNFKVSLQTNNTSGQQFGGPTGFNPAPGTIYDWIIAKVGNGLVSSTLPYIQLTTNFDTDHPYRFSIFTINNATGPDYVGVRYTYNAVPEATTLLLGMAGLTPLLLQRRRQRPAAPQTA